MAAPAPTRAAATAASPHHYRCAPAGSTDRRQVVAVAFGLFAQSGVLQHFDLDPRTLVRFLLVVRDLCPGCPCSRSHQTIRVTDAHVPTSGRLSSRGRNALPRKLFSAL